MSLFTWNKETKHTIVRRTFLPGIHVELSQWQAALLDWCLLGLLLLIIGSFLIAGDYFAVVIFCGLFIGGYILGRYNS